MIRGRRSARKELERLQGLLPRGVTLEEAVQWAAHRNARQERMKHARYRVHAAMQSAGLATPFEAEPLLLRRAVADAVESTEQHLRALSLVLRAADDAVVDEMAMSARGGVA